MRDFLFALTVASIIGVIGGGVVYVRALADEPVTPTPAAATWSAPLGDAPVPTVGKRLTWKERKKLGLTFCNVLRIMKQLKADKTLSHDSSIASVQVFAQLVTENPKAFESIGPSVDWDLIMEWLERIIELILKLLPIFI